jgi:hypothetical protein
VFRAASTLGRLAGRTPSAVGCFAPSAGNPTATDALFFSASGAAPGPLESSESAWFAVAFEDPPSASAVSSEAASGPLGSTPDSPLAAAVTEDCASFAPLFDAMACAVARAAAEFAGDCAAATPLAEVPVATAAVASTGLAPDSAIAPPGPTAIGFAVCTGACADVALTPGSSSRLVESFFGPSLASDSSGRDADARCAGVSA